MSEAISTLTNDFKIFHAQCQRLEITLNMHQDLFEAETPQRMMMTGMAHHFFNDLSHILQNEFLVQVYKLTDNASVRTKGEERANLTFLRIQCDLDACGLLGDNDTRQQIAACVDTVQQFREDVAKEARNRVCAHLDRETLRDLFTKDADEQGPGAHEDHQREAFFDSMYRFCELVAGLLNIEVAEVKDVGRLPGASAKEIFQWVEHRIKRPNRRLSGE